MNMEYQVSERGTLSVYELDKAGVAALQNDSYGELHCYRLTDNEVNQVQQVMEHTGLYEPDIVRSRLGKGRWGYAGRLDDDQHAVPITYGWVALDATSLGSTGLDFVPPLGEAYLFDFATAFDYRGHGYYPILLRFILKDLAKHQIARAWIATAPGNAKSARSIARAGFKKVADTLYSPWDYNIPPQMRLVAEPGISPILLEIGQKAHVANHS